VGGLICGFLFFFFPAAIMAIVLGHLSLSDIRKSAGRLQGQGIAVAGLVLGYLGVVMIPFILIIAAIAIPNFLRAKMAANEASAVGSLRTIGTAASSYNATYSNGYPPSLDALGGEGEGDCDRAALLRGPLAFGRRNGYIFTYQARDSLGAPAANKGCTMAGGTGFTVTAEPLTRGTSGQRSFFIDETGVIRFDSSGTASAESQPLR
jgi:type II secretory pathway pseudopilin PulG